MDSENRAEAFERIAFEAAKERDLYKWVLTHHFDTCDVCANRETECDGECDLCGSCDCPCRDCWINGTDDNFVLDIELVEEKIKKENEND